MFIPDPKFFHLGSRFQGQKGDPDFFHPGSRIKKAPDPGSGTVYVPYRVPIKKKNFT
jgi:hypothetical protein